MSLLSAKEIMEIIPHRQPFMLIDTVEELIPARSADRGSTGPDRGGGHLKP